ncbi:hypothetical protein H5410_032736 [Solanum commersonii]|uniref:Uncharacterized protein n=1 Tax=Solanum commersonii TaxID=4109 RepID=A0A9J5YR46_SOLCO|nr:hypothetical protein H5410_032736 [Solanum commersonii]
MHRWTFGHTRRDKIRNNAQQGKVRSHSEPTNLNLSKFKALDKLRKPNRYTDQLELFGASDMKYEFGLDVKENDM